MVDIFTIFLLNYIQFKNRGKECLKKILADMN